MTTAAQDVTRNEPETDSRKKQVTVSRAIHVFSTEDQPRRIVSHRDRMCHNLPSRESHTVDFFSCLAVSGPALRGPVTGLVQFSF